MKGRDNTRRSRTTQGAGPDPKTGHHSTYHPPAIQQGSPTKQRGTPTPNEGDTDTRREGHHQHRRPSITMPPHLVMPPHHPQCPHPAPMPGRVQTREPHHTNSTETHTPPHTTHSAENNTSHDSSTDEYCTGMRWGTGHDTGPGKTTAAHTTAIPLDTRTRDGHHPLTSHCSRSHTNQRS